MKKDVVIESSQNSIFKSLKELSSSSGIKKQSQFILMGEKLIQEFLSSKSSDLQKKFPMEAEILVTGGESIISKTKFANEVQKIFLSPALFKEVDIIGTHSNLLLLKAPAIQQQDPMVTPAGLELICPLGDPSNLGALTRSAVAFGIQKMILTEEASHPYHPKAIKSSAGASLHMNFSRTISFPKMELVHQFKPSYLLDLDGTSIEKFKWPQNLFLIVGEEGPGFQRLKDYKNISSQQKITVSTANVESLNATVATSCALFAFSTSKQKIN